MRSALIFPWFLLGMLGCGNGFESPSLVDTLRVLAVTPEPASGTPGQTSNLSITVADGAKGAASGGQARPLQIAWLAGCHNPPTRQFFGCYPLLTALAAHLSPRVLDTPQSEATAVWFGTGTTYALRVPVDILSAAPQGPGDPIHFGVSFAFFAVCAGELRPRADLTDRVPFDCVDPKSGATLGRRDFVTGVTTLFSYEAATNHNPELTGVHFGSAELHSALCKSDADCAGQITPEAAGFELVCGSLGTCSPSFPACSGKNCPEILVSPDVPRTSAEPLPGESAHETVWASFYSTAGSFDSATQLINDHGAGFITDHGSLFRLPADHTGPIGLWVTVNDQRGGVAVQAFEVRLH